MHTAHTGDILGASGSGDKEDTTSGPTGHLYIRLLHEDQEASLIYLIHRKKHRKSDKMNRHRNMFQMKRKKPQRKN